MIGIVIVTHARLASELLQAAELILGSLPLVEAVSIDREMSVELVHNHLEQVISSIGADGVLIMTDLFGGTPTNISAEFLSPGKVEIITGVNLPMLIKATSARTNADLDGLACLLLEYGKKAIMRPSELLGLL